MGRMNNFVGTAAHEEPELQHFSHVHALQLFDVQYHGEAVCDACKLPCAVGRAYRCAPCNYFLDKTCAHTPRAIRHPGHPGHTLTLLVVPTYAGGSFCCDACGGRGTAFSFHCTECEFDLHISCANAPLQVHHHSHPHPLALAFSAPYDAGSTFACDVCVRTGGPNNWLYRCAPCGFDAHIGCATASAPPQGGYAGHYHRQQQQQPQEHELSRVPRGTLQSFPSQPPPQATVNAPAAPESQTGAVGDALAVQMLAFGMQQAKLQNQMVNSMIQMHNQRLSRPFTSTWQVDGFMTAPKVPRPDAGGLMTSLMQNVTNMSLDAGIAIAGASPAFGTTALSGLLGQPAQGNGGFGGQPASADDDFLARFLKGDDSSGTEYSQLNTPSGDPEEFLNNLIRNLNWIPNSYAD